MRDTKKAYLVSHRENRLYDRRESGYDPEYGLVVNLRNDGNMVRILGDANAWLYPIAGEAAYRVRSLKLADDTLPSHFGAVLVAQETLKTARESDDPMLSIFGPPTAASALRDARRKLPPDISESPYGPIADLRKCQNLRLLMRKSTLEGRYTYSSSAEQEEICTELGRIQAEISRRYNSEAISMRPPATRAELRVQQPEANSP